MATPVQYCGREYPSFKVLFESNAAQGITYASFIRRLKNGWNLKRALTEQLGKSTQRTYLVDGRQYRTLKALSEAAGISYQAAVKRMHRGWTDEEILNGKRNTDTDETIPKEKKPRGEPVQVKGVTYENLRHAYDSIQPSVSFNTVRARLRYRWSVEEALEAIEKIDGRKANPRVRELTLNGETFSAKQAAEKFGIPYATLLDRVNRGATAEQAIGLAPIGPYDLVLQSEAYRDRKAIVKKTYIVDGATYKSIPELANAFGLSPQLVYNRMRDNGWSAKQAVTEPISESVTVDGTTYRSAMNAWETIGLTSFSAYGARKTKGYPLDICLGLKPLPSSERYELHGKIYGSIAEVALAYHLTTGKLSSRLQRMSLEEAVDYSPSNGRYSVAIFKENPALAQCIGRLYFIRITLPSGTLHKVGITLKDVSQRFCGFVYQIIAEYQGALSVLYQVEQKVLAEFRDYHYRADEDFEGKTETFLLMDEEEMEMLRSVALLASTHGCSDVQA